MMVSLLLTALLPSVASAVCEVHSVDGNSLEQRAYSSSALNISSNPSSFYINGSHGNENAVINFVEGGYTFIGRTTVEMGSEETLSQLISSKYLHILRKFPPAQVFSHFEPFYIVSIKLSLRLSNSGALWTAAKLEGMMTILQRHLQQHDSKQKLELSISSASGERAFLKIEDVPCILFRIRYQPHPGATRDDAMNIVFYTSEPAPESDATRAINIAIRSITSHEPDSLVQPNTEIYFPAGTTLLRIKTLPVDAMTADITYGALYTDLRTVKSLVRSRVPSGWCVYQAVLRNADGKFQGRLQYVLDPVIQDTPVVSIADEEDRFNSTAVNRTAIAVS